MERLEAVCLDELGSLVLIKTLFVKLVYTYVFTTTLSLLTFLGLTNDDDTANNKTEANLGIRHSYSSKDADCLKEAPN